MKFYALRHTRTGKLMPRRASGRGYTWWEPSQLANGAIHVPRIFTTKRSASLARSWWLKGGAGVKYRTDSYGDVITELVRNPMGRTNQELRVVEIAMEVVA